MTTELTPAQRLIGDFSPRFVQLTDDVLFGEVWGSTEISARDRSLITLAALVALNRTEQYPVYMKRALDSGVTEGELKELLVHLGFYAGWPSAMTATLAAKKLLSADAT